MSGRTLLAGNLRSLRTDRGWSHERLAADAGVDRAWVSELERGLGNTSIDLLDRIAAALEVPSQTCSANPPRARSHGNRCPADDGDKGLAGTADLYTGVIVI
jgi:transcriptional regulator with XRE-family HTH domain